MAARLLLRRVLSARSVPRPPPSARCSHSGAEARLETPSAKKLTDIGIRRIFSSEHDIFRESVRKFFQEEVVPYHTEWEKAGEVSRELWEKAGKQGLLGVNIAEKHGGIGGDLFSTAVTWEEQAYSNCTGPGFSLHSDIVMPYIANYGTKEQIEHFIPQMTAGKCIGAIAMTEPGAGSLFLVENGMKGFINRKLHKMGMKAQDSRTIFEDVRLPASALLGEENKGFYYLMQELPQTVQHKLAELKTNICVTRAFVDSCLQLHESKRLDSGTASMAKYWASELQNSVAYDCVQLHGGWGYMWEYPIARAYVDARVQPIYGGTNEIMRELIARQIISDS
ncbi:hypothetical protein STEG23_015797 [Scotinomys teguina]